MRMGHREVFSPFSLLSMYFFLQDIYKNIVDKSLLTPQVL